MRKIITILAFILTIFTSCKNEQEKKLDKIHQNVESYLVKNLNDPSSYQSIEFSKPDSLFEYFKDTKQYTQISDSINLSLESWRELTNLYGSISTENAWSHVRYDWYSGSKYDKVEKRQLDSLNIAMKKMENLSHYLMNLNDSLDSVYVPKFIGYKIMHKYRAKNKMGALELEEKTFKLNTDLEVLK